MLEIWAAEWEKPKRPLKSFTEPNGRSTSPLRSDIFAPFIRTCQSYRYVSIC